MSRGAAKGRNYAMLFVKLPVKPAGWPDTV